MEYKHTLDTLGVGGFRVHGRADKAFRAGAAVLVARRRRWLCTAAAQNSKAGLYTWHTVGKKVAETGRE